MAVLYAITGSTMNWAASTWGLAITGGAWVQAAKTLTKAGAFVGLTGTPVVDVGGVLYTVETITDDVLTMSATGAKTNADPVTFAIFNQAQPVAGDVVHLNGCEITANENANIPTAYTTAALGSGQLASIDSLNIAGTTTNGHIDINMTTVGAAKAIGCVSILAGTVAALVSAGLTNLLTIDCTGGEALGGGSANAKGVSIGSHPFQFHGSCAGGLGSNTDGIYLGSQSGAQSLSILHATGGQSTGAGVSSCGLKYDHYAVVPVVTLSGNATGGKQTLNFGINGYSGYITVNGGNWVDTPSRNSAGMNGVNWNPSSTSYHKVAGAGTPLMRLESAIVASTKVLSGTPRWTGATGADIGTLPYTRKRGASR